AVTVPVAPPLKVTTLLAGVVENPKPLIVIDVALAARFAELVVMTGSTVATCTAAPLLTPLLVTDAVKLPTTRPLRLVTVNCVAVEAVTVPVAPPEKVTTLFAGVPEKPKPLIVIDVALAPRFAVFAVITGTTVATCTAAPLLVPLVVTTTVKLPALAGFVEKLTVSDVRVDAVTE